MCIFTEKTSQELKWEDLIFSLSQSIDPWKSSTYVPFVLADVWSGCE